MNNMNIRENRKSGKAGRVDTSGNYDQRPDRPDVPFSNFQTFQTYSFDLLHHYHYSRQVIPNDISLTSSGWMANKQSVTSVSSTLSGHDR